MARTGALLLALLAAGGCSSSTPSPAVQPAQARTLPAAQQTPRAGDEIPWAADRPLTWADFRGTAPLDGGEGAHTVYLLSYESRCRGGDFTFTVTALMLPSQSWVKPQVLASPGESVRHLRHEQTHFNLTEVYARRMRKFFAELYNPCGQKDKRLEEEAVDRFGREESEAQRRYDDETGFGLRPQPQARWDDDVARMLADLTPSLSRP